MHMFRLGETDGAAHQPFNPSPQIDVFALDFLRVLLAHLMLLSIQMPLVGPQPSVENFVIPNGANSCWSFRKTSSFRRPNTYAKTVPVR